MRYRVARLDTAGNEFRPIAWVFATKEEAERKRDALTMLGHHQTYWVEEVAPESITRDEVRPFRHHT